MKRMRLVVLATVVALTLAASAMGAAGDAVVRVLNQGSPVPGVPVDILTSDGVSTFITDANGVVQFNVGDRQFRVRVNGSTDTRLLKAADSPVNFELP